MKELQRLQELPGLTKLTGGLGVCLPVPGAWPRQGHPHTESSCSQDKVEGLMRALRRSSLWL